MCDCKETGGFKQKLAEARNLTAETGETHIVYAKEVPGHGKHVFLTKESLLTDELGICCYYLPNGKEVVYEPKGSQKKAKKATKTVKKEAEIVVKESETIESAQEQSEETPSPDEA